MAKHFSDQKYNLRIVLDTKNSELSPGELAKMDATLASLERVVRRFPVSDLHIAAERHPRSMDIEVRTALRLPAGTLFTGDHDEAFHPAFRRCVRKLIHKAEALADKLGDKPEHRRAKVGTEHHVMPVQPPDIEAVEDAVRESDFLAFRRGMDTYEDALRHRIGRWIQRYPQAEAQLGDRFTLDDLVEEVFLNAFERFERRPPIPVGAWLEELIDGSVRTFLENPDAARENVSFVRSFEEADRQESE